VHAVRVMWATVGGSAGRMAVGLQQQVCVLTQMQSEDCGTRPPSGSARRDCAGRPGQALRALRGGRACILQRRAPGAAARRGADASGAAHRCATCCRRLTWCSRSARAAARARWRAASAACWPCRRAGSAAGPRMRQGRRAEGRAAGGRAPGDGGVLAYVGVWRGHVAWARVPAACCPPAKQHFMGIACVVKLSRAARLTTADA